MTGVLGLLMLVQWIRVVTTRIELTEAGLRINSQGGRAWGGSPLIPFEGMKGLRDPDDRYRKKKSDWVELDYELADGTTGCVRLNIYVHKAFHEVMAVICWRSAASRTRRAPPNPTNRQRSRKRPRPPVPKGMVSDGRRP